MRPAAWISGFVLIGVASALGAQRIVGSSNVSRKSAAKMGESDRTRIRARLSAGVGGALQALARLHAEAKIRPPPTVADQAESDIGFGYGDEEIDQTSGEFSNAELRRQMALNSIGEGCLSSGDGASGCVFRSWPVLANGKLPQYVTVKAEIGGVGSEYVLTASTSDGIQPKNFRPVPFEIARAKRDAPTVNAGLTVSENSDCFAFAAFSEAGKSGTVNRCRPFSGEINLGRIEVYPRERVIVVPQKEPLSKGTICAAENAGPQGRRPTGALVSSKFSISSGGWPLISTHDWGALHIFCREPSGTRSEIGDVAAGSAEIVMADWANNLLPQSNKGNDLLTSDKRQIVENVSKLHPPKRWHRPKQIDPVY